MKTHSHRLVTLALCCVRFLTAQPVDDTQLKQVIIFGRHGVRSPVVPYKTLNTFSVRPVPSFNVAPGNQAIPSSLTLNGATNETILGGYFRLWLTQEKLLTGNDSADAAFAYFRATGTPLIFQTAQAFTAGMLPAANITINSYNSPAFDPLFDPVDAGVALLNERMAVAAVMGRLGGDPQSLASAYAPELALTRSVLLNYPVGQTPLPATPANVFDVTAGPIEIGAGISTSPVSLGALTNVIYAIDPFVMEYADGMPPSDVGWGQLTAGGVSQITRLYNLALDLEYRTPYLAGVQSSNVASHVVRSLVQAATGNPITGALGNPSTKLIVLTGSNTNITGLAGLFHLDWLVAGYPADTCAPGGALIFELRQSQSTGAYIVRTSYITQTMDQLRNLSVLTLDKPPANVPVFVPGCSVRNATFDCPLGSFVRVAIHAIDPQSADLKN